VTSEQDQGELRPPEGYLGATARITSGPAPELVEAGTRHLYISYPCGQGDSKLTNVAIERLVQSRGTARNWNTIRKIHSALIEA